MRIRRRLSSRLLATVLAAAVLGGLTGAVATAVTGTRAAPQQQALLAPAFQPVSEGHYVAVTPCRVVDTRAGTGTGGTPFTSLQTRTYYVGGTFGYAAQGGKSGGCGIPVGATAIAATFLAVSPDGAGRLHAWPNGQTEPTATTFYYGTLTGSSGTTVTVNPATSYSLKVRNYGGPTDVVVDVTGYYVKPLTAVFAPNGDLYSGTSRALSSVRDGVGVYRVTFDRDVRNCAMAATVYVTGYVASANSFTFSAARQVEVRVRTLDGVAADQYVYLQATC